MTSVKVRLEPNNKQITKLFQCAGTARFIYNWTLAKQEENYALKGTGKNGGKFISDNDLNWYISVDIEITQEIVELTEESIGIDLGIKDLAICSNIQEPYKNINKTKKVKKLEKKLRRLQRKVSNKYQLNKKGGSYVKTSNIIKLEKNIIQES